MWRRSPVVAGSFYLSNPQRLTSDIDTYIKKAGKTAIKETLYGLVVPHAGYIYSGPVAAYSYAQLAGSGVEVAVVLAPSHRARFDGASIIPSGIFETPLGDVTIDATLGDELMKQPHIDFIKEAHLQEHSLEVQVPFLQRVLGAFTLVPIIIGSIDIDVCADLAKEIAAVLAHEKRKYVVVISTDLSHYYSYERAKQMDGLFIDTLKSFDAEKLYGVLGSEKAQACGEGPVLTGMMLTGMLGAKNVHILKYANSGDTAGPRDQVVGYCAAAITG